MSRNICFLYMYIQDICFLHMYLYIYIYMYVYPSNVYVKILVYVKNGILY